MRAPKTRGEMIEFLAGHFRYSTMNSWNGSHAWAANVKIRNLRIPAELQDRAYEALEIEEPFDAVRDVLHEFDRAHDWRYQIGFNGRSGGYLVLYRGGRKVSDHKSYCTNCGQRNFRAIEDGGNICGVCHKPKRVNHTFMDVFTTPGQSIGTADRAELDEMSTDELRAEIKLVCEFDAAVESARRAFIETIRNSEVVEEIYTVEKTRKMLVRKED